LKSLGSCYELLTRVVGFLITVVIAGHYGNMTGAEPVIG
jgi:hypothetical protein